MNKMDNSLSKKYKDLAKEAGVDRSTIYLWQKKGILESELAKKGVRKSPDFFKIQEEDGKVWSDGEIKEEDAPWGKAYYMRKTAGDGSGYWVAMEATKEEKEWTKKEAAKTMKIANERNPGSMREGVEHFPAINKIETGFNSLDEALGGGVAEGKLIEIFGKNSTGKTSLAIQIAANFQKQGKKVVYFDAENAMDLEYAQTLGLDVEAVHWETTFVMEEMMESLRDVCRSGSARLAIVDSVASLVPNPEMEGRVGDANMMIKAKLMSQICRMITGYASDNKVTVLFINQQRDGINAQGFPIHYTPGGHALLYHCNQRIELKDLTQKQTSLKPSDKTERKEISLNIVKNKAGKPAREVRMILEYGKGFLKSDKKGG